MKTIWINIPRKETLVTYAHYLRTEFSAVRNPRHQHSVALATDPPRERSRDHSGPRPGLSSPDSQ